MVIIMNVVKKILKFVRCIKSYTLYPKQNLEYKRKYFERQAIILMGEPEYNNLGDHAIAYATEKFVQIEFPDFEYFSITENDIKYNMKNVSKIINEGDILLLQGGGNMGDMYPDQVEIRRKVIEKFNNEIIIMPQTIYFENSEESLPRYYHKNEKRLTLVAREQVSYEIMQRIFHGNTILTPDIVLYLNRKMKEPSIKNRQGALVCLRNDKEKAANNNAKDDICEALERLSIEYKLFSTVIDKSIYSNEREQYLNALFETFYKTRIVITDRLHAMIISAITGTPCLVMPTINHKVLKSYSWLEEFNYIEMLTSSENVFCKIEQMLQLEVRYDKDISSCFVPLKEVFGEKIERVDLL